MSIRPKLTLEQRVALLERQAKAMRQCCDAVEKWIKAEVKWSQEVTKMLKSVNWAKLVTDYPSSGGGALPPKDPPTYP